MIQRVMNVNYSPAYTANVRAVTCNLQSQLYVCKTTPHVFTRVSLLNRQFHETFKESRFLYKSIMYYRLSVIGKKSSSACFLYVFFFRENLFQRCRFLDWVALSLSLCSVDVIKPVHHVLHRMFCLLAQLVGK